MKIDDTDVKILKILQKRGDCTKAEIARRLGLAPSAVFERVKRLERDGVIIGYEAKIRPQSLGLGLTAYIFIAEAKPARGGETARRLAAMTALEEVHRIAGEDCYLAKVRAADTRALTLILDDIGAIESVNGVRTSIVLDTFKEGFAESCDPDEQ